MAGDSETGVTIHETVEALDAGPIAAQEAFPVAADDDAGAVYARAAEVAARLLGGVLARPEPRLRPAAGGGRDVRGEDRARRPGARPRGPAAGGRDRVRALSPHIGARAVVAGVPLLVWRARVGDDGSLELLEVQPEGRRRMSWDEYLRGRP